jgi:GNAT superfamily N-acetyltransferase
VSEIKIRQAIVNDAALILNFIKELAIYEKAETEVKATLSDIEDSIFAAKSTCDAIICELDGEAVGFAVYFFNYSTWLGKNGLYLEDLYVSPEHRNAGAGKALLKYLAKFALTMECGRFEWSVLDWNEPAILFYRSIGASPQDGWVKYRLDHEGIKVLANS